ncbi:MAG: hypothetical protein AAB641_00505 [Patescibacteria group bacterium]
MALLTLTAPVQAQEEVTREMKVEAARAFVTGQWVDRSLIGRANPLFESSYLTQDCVATITNATRETPRGLLFGMMKTNKQVFIFEEEGRTVYLNATVGISFDKLGELKKLDPAFTECVQQVRERKGFPKKYLHLFLGFHGVQ